jgi:ABC-type lipoprotein export system ATPase subunit
MTQPVLDIQSLSRTYTGPDGAVTALEDVTLTVDVGEFISIQGQSGCGKSTLLLAAGGLLAPDQGTVRVTGTNLYTLRHEERAHFRAHTIGFVFQQFHLIPYLSVVDNILAPSLALSGENDVRERATELIERFALGHRARHVPSELSTGERQRTALARALLNRPKLILADEPTGNLDGENTERVLGALSELADEGRTVVLVTHDARVADHARRTVRLQSGRLVEA